MNKEIKEYNEKLTEVDKEICEIISDLIDTEMADLESKIWHSHPVWFLNENPIVGYSKQKAGIRLMFWSGSDFGEEDLAIRGEKFKDASIFYNNVSSIDFKKIKIWLQKSRVIQWDYKNLVKRKGLLEKLKIS